MTSNDLQENDIIVMDGIKYIITAVHEKFVVALNQFNTHKTILKPMKLPVRYIGKGRVGIIIETIQTSNVIIST